jgi:hypothetical protein
MEYPAITIPSGPHTKNTCPGYSFARMSAVALAAARVTHSDRIFMHSSQTLNIVVLRLWPWGRVGLADWFLFTSLVQVPVVVVGVLTIDVIALA